ncbi:dermonecrotic toxin domain-containing protein [Pseudomonas sp. K2I15]|uniref:dermonecrotic toxin domain-containing protein n=2 Tax=unclassified Pseudomonas TaxID=196821 RepID=UPI000B4D41F2|nr:DUF6543 domain-containing protein [Pseudomonas sp. K2I15]OWP68929.1 hypothetical protein CEC48_25780 [Pseudomonas sp. K2I15]
MNTEQDDSDTLNEQAQIRQRLTRRLDASAHPSRFINELHAAEVRCRDAIKQLRRLLEPAPGIYRLVRKGLREAFALDPDTLLFSEPSTPGGPQVVDSLTDRALGLLDNPAFPININRYTRLSMSTDASFKVAFTASDALHKVNALDFPARIKSAIADYWQALAFGSAVSREERWVQVHNDYFAERAFLAHALYDLSDHGFAMALGILDAPTPQAREQAGGAWERLQVGELVWPTGTGREVPFSGALHIYRAGDERTKRQVVYLPGSAKVFHEFASLAQMQLTLPARVQGPERAALWQRLPLAHRQALAQAFTVRRSAALTDDALRHSALAQLNNQRDNEWGCLLARHASRVFEGTAGALLSAAQRLKIVERGRRPAPASERLRAALDQLLEWDRRRRGQEVNCATLRPGLAMRTAEDLVRRHEQGALALLNKADLSEKSRPYDILETLQAQWLDLVSAVHALLDGQEHRLGLREFWQEKAPGSTRHRAAQRLNAQRSALTKEAQLQYGLGLINDTDLALLIEVLDKPLADDRGNSPTRVLQLSVGRARQPLYRLTGAFVVTTAEALEHTDRRLPVVLHLPGKDGGLQAFDSLNELSKSLDLSLKCPDGSMLWQCIGRDQRQEARAVIGALGMESTLVYFEVLQGNLLSETFKEQIRQYAQVERWVVQGGRPFNEVKDLALMQTLLARELADTLQLPLSVARAQALANVSVLRLAVAQAKTLPAWLASASPVLRKRYQRQQTHCIASAMVVEQQLAEVLPSLEDFARRTLIAQLMQEELHPLLDIDTPFLDMPDDVSTHWESHPQRPAGDSGIRTVVSSARHTYSLLQLALHNLDPDAPWTRWRLQHSRYLEPLWAKHLPARRLIQLIAELDLAGQYERLIAQAFYPSSPQVTAGLSQALLERPVIQRARLEQFSTTQQGLSEAALSLFSTALAARTPADLGKNGHQIQLCCVHLAALTLEQPRHVTGMLIIHDQRSAKALLYWPGVQGYPALTEHGSVAAARRALLKVAVAPGNLKALATKMAPGWEQQALESYPATLRSTGSMLEPGVPSIVRGYSFFPSPIRAWWWAMDGIRRWFMVRRAQPATALSEVEKEIREQLEADPGQWLGITGTTGCDLLRILTHGQVLGLEREVRAVANSARALASYRELRLGEQSAARVRGLLSFIPGVSIGVNLYEVLLAARRFHHSGDPRDGMAMGFATLILIGDVALTAMPQTKGAPRAGLPIRPLSMVPALNQIRRQQRPFSTLGLPPARKALKGMEAYRKELSTEGAITLHGPVNKGSRVKAGEQFIVEDGHAYPAHRRRNERVLRIKNPKGSGEDELFLAIEQPREWLLGADAPEPRAGTSSRVRRPWETPVGGTEWVAPTASHTERVARQPPLVAGYWQAWGQRLVGRPVQEISASRRLYRVQGDQAYDAVRLGDNYFELLPNGSNVPEGIIFIRNPELPDARPGHDLLRRLSSDVRVQPIPATFGADQLWTPRQPLFSRPLFDSVRDAFPGLTPASNRFVTERLVELADSGRSMTASRMLNVRTTLDDWLPPVPRAAGYTDDLLRMLRPVVRGGRVSVNIGVDGLVPGLERVDFQLPVPLAPSIINNTQSAIGHARPVAAQNAVRQVLEGQGFAVDPLYKSNSAQLFNFACTHPKSNNLYYVLTRWAESPSIALGSGGALQLSDAWFRAPNRSTMRHQKALHRPILQALDEGRLVRIIAGIQRVGRSNRVTVFFVKLSDV